MTAPAPSRPPGALRCAFYYTMRALLMGLFTVFFRFRRFGHHRLPASGPCLIVANHQSYLDPPILGLCLRGRMIHPIAREGLFENRLLAPVITALNAIPVKEGGEADVGAMREALRRLEEGKVVCLFPEGSRTPDGAVHDFQRGAALLIRRAKAPVTPIAIEGAFDAWPRTRSWPRLWGQRIGAAVGEPIDHEMLMAGGADAAIERLREQIESMRLDLRQRLRNPARSRAPRRRGRSERSRPTAA